MFGRCSERARRTFSTACYEAGRLGKGAVSSEHLLLAIVRERDEIVGALLEHFGAAPEEIRRRARGGDISVAPLARVGDLPLDEDCRSILVLAAEESDRLGLGRISLSCLWLAILRLDGCAAAGILTGLGFTLARARFEVRRISDRMDESRVDGSPSSALEEFGTDLVRLARRQRLDPLVLRDREVGRLMEILSRRTKSNPLLVGDPGTGKTAVVEGLAQRIADGEVPDFLLDKRLVALDLAGMVAGAKHRGEFEERLQAVLAEVRRFGDRILFIDEIHSVLGAGGSEGALDAAQILKPALARGEISCIGATTGRELRLHLEKDRALLRRFQPLEIGPPSPEEALLILEGVRDRYEEFHGVRYTPDALRAAVTLSVRYLPDRQLPDKALDLLDESGARAKVRGNGEVPEVTAGDVAAVLAAATGIPVARLTASETGRLREIEVELRRRVVGQERAVQAVCRSLRRSRLGLADPRRPVGSFLFAGPPGVGKTEVARRLAELLFGSRGDLLRFDMSELMEAAAVSRLIGAPPGYAGFEEGGELTGRIRSRPYSVVLFDEIEKAHPRIVDVLLQILEDGRLTDAAGEVADFTHAVVLLTSNAGSRRLASGGDRPGFGGAATAETREADMLEEVRRVFRPELLDRLDEVVVFRSLGREDLQSICGLLLEEIVAQLAEREVRLEVEPPVRDWLLERAGLAADPTAGHGARPLRRAVQRHLQDAVSEALLALGGRTPARLRAAVEGGALRVEAAGEGRRGASSNPG